MRQLFLHIGTNKTGSSFIQTVLTHNKEYLIQEGFYLPDSKFDQMMLDGNITPGNGHNLAKSLHNEDFENIIKELDNHFEEAEKLNLSKVLLSNEVIIRLFANNSILELLDRACKELNISSVNCLGIIRDLPGHSLSLYRHRAKYGDYANLQKWFQEDYEFLRVTRDFLKNKFHYNWNFILQPYQKSSTFIIDKVLCKFLMITNNQLVIPQNQRINASLSLDQIRLLQWLKRTNPYNAKKLSIEWQKRTVKRTNSQKLVSYFQNQLEIYLSQNSELLHEVESLLEFELREENKNTEVEEMASWEYPTISEEEYHVLLANYKKDWEFWARKFKEKFNIHKKESFRFNSDRYGGNLQP